MREPARPPGARVAAPVHPLVALALFGGTAVVTVVIAAFSFSLARGQEPAGLLFAAIALPLPLATLHLHHRDVVAAFGRAD